MLVAGLNPTAFALLPPEYEPSVDSGVQSESPDEERSRGIEGVFREIGG